LSRFISKEVDAGYRLENERQQELEEWLIGYHDDCTWYSVVYVGD
jgi:hypothetical protein